VSPRGTSVQLCHRCDARCPISAEYTWTPPGSTLRGDREGPPLQRPQLLDRYRGHSSWPLVHARTDRLQHPDDRERRIGPGAGVGHGVAGAMVAIDAAAFHARRFATGNGRVAVGQAREVCNAREAYVEVCGARQLKLGRTRQQHGSVHDGSPVSVPLLTLTARTFAPRLAICKPRRARVRRDLRLSVSRRSSNAPLACPCPYQKSDPDVLWWRPPRIDADYARTTEMGTSRRPLTDLRTGRLPLAPGSRERNRDGRLRHPASIPDAERRKRHQQRASGRWPSASASRQLNARRALSRAELVHPSGRRGPSTSTGPP